MNNSQRTKLIGEGVALYAAFMDVPGSGVDTPEWKAWAEYHDRVPAEYTQYIREKHNRMFDEINLLF